MFLARVSFQDFIIFAAVLVGLALLVRAIKISSALIAKKFPKHRMSMFAWIPLFNFGIYFVGTFTAFAVIFEPKKEVYLSFLASVLVAVGFAAKDIVASVMAGVVLLLDKPFQVGDRVTFGDVYGEITSIGLRSVKLLTLDESVVTIPNSRLVTDVVSSSSAGELGMMTTVDMHISPRADVAQARKILADIAHKSDYVDAAKNIVVVGKEILGLAGVVSVTLKTKCIIKDARTERAFQTEFLVRANEEFKRYNVVQNVD